MKKIKIWADYNSTGIFYWDGEPIYLEDTSISKKTWEEIQKWVDAYELYTPMLPVERKPYMGEMLKLDEIGIKLLKKIREEWNIDKKSGENLDFFYYSEGFCKYL